MDVPTLTSDRVTLRALREDDVEGCYEQCVDPESVRWTTVPVPFTPQMAREFCLEIAPGAWADGSQFLFAVEVEGRYAGNIALRDEGGGRFEVAFGSHPWVRGTGAMTEALRLLIDWGFAARGARCVVWRANVGNWASRKLAWRLGFHHEGLLRRYLHHRGELVDAWVGTLLPTDERRPAHAWCDTPVLDGGGGGPAVRLRPLRDDDVPRVVEACSDPRTVHWLGTLPAPYEERHARIWFEAIREKQATGRGTTWAVVDPADDLLLGAISTFDVEAERECEVGYWTHPDARGRGVMTAAMRRLVAYCFEELRLQQVRSVAAVENLASRHVIESVGLTFTGTERRATTVATGLADVALYDVLAEEWTGTAAASERR